MSIPWWTVQTVGTELDNLKLVLDSGYLNEGEVATNFENRLSEIFGVSNVVVTTSGTAALFLALKSAGIRQGDLVGVPNLTFIATASAVKLAGGEVLLLDVDPVSMTVSNDEILRAKRSGVKAIIPVHVSGRSAWNEELRQVLSENEITVIEDAAEAMGSKDPTTGKHLGTIGHAGIFSFSPNKVITTGQGGALLTNDDLLAGNARSLKDQGRPVRGTGGADRHDLEGYNFKFTNIQSAVGISQLEDLEKRIIFLTELYNSYRKAIFDCEHQRLLPFSTKAGEFPLWPEINFKNKKEALNKLDKAGIGYREIWHPISTQKPYFSTSKFPNSTALSESTIWLPSSFQLSSDQVATITKTLECEICR
jgi:perosamine synthetase